MDRARQPRPRRGGGREHPLNADHADQLRLLDVQGLDARIDQLAHRRRTLSQLGEIERVTGETAQVRDLLVAARTEKSDIEREVAKTEADVEAVRARSARDRQRMDAGQVGSAKELEALQHEVGTLARRQSDLEELELEAMERLEEVQGRVGGLEDRTASLAGELAELERQRDEAFADIDKDTAYLTGERERVADGLPGDLMTLYEKLRVDHGGVGAAGLQHGRCLGCRLQLTPTELARIRNAPPDEVQRCEECRRILVRTPDSGL